MSARLLEGMHTHAFYDSIPRLDELETEMWTFGVGGLKEDHLVSRQLLRCRFIARPPSQPRPHPGRHPQHRSGGSCISRDGQARP